MLLRHTSINPPRRPCCRYHGVQRVGAAAVWVRCPIGEMQYLISGYRTAWRDILAGQLLSTSHTEKFMLQASHFAQDRGY
jgi:hypothetical protein